MGGDGGVKFYEDTKSYNPVPPLCTIICINGLSHKLVRVKFTVTTTTTTTTDSRLRVTVIVALSLMDNSILVAAVFTAHVCLSSWMLSWTVTSYKLRGNA